MSNMPLSSSDFSSIDAWWRAANYLSVGQIYLLDNPLLREPLTLKHIKPRLLGHWGTTPGLNFLYVHLNRVIKARDLDMIFVAGPGPWRPGHRCQHLARRHLQRDLSARAAERARHAAPVQAVQLSRRHSEPRGARDARLDPRGRRTRLRAVACLWRGVRQSRPHRRLRRRRRRGGNRADGDVVALQQIPQPRHRWRGAADPASQRLQDRQPDGAGAHSARANSTSLFVGYGYKPYLVEGDDPPAMHQLWRRDARPRVRRNRARSSAPRGRAGSKTPPDLADDHPEDARRAGPGRRRSTGSRPKAFGARIRCRSPRWRPSRRM